MVMIIIYALHLEVAALNFEVEKLGFLSFLWWLLALASKRK